MADDNAPATGNQVAVRPQRALVADAIPVFDTNRFEHYGRIAVVLADSSLVPDTLKDNANRQVSIANCFQVVELADRWGYSPFAVAQCASVVHGKLMLEGKLVAAVLQSKLGAQLHHYFTGTWGTDDYRIFVTDCALDPAIVNELSPHQKIPGVRMIDGSVGEWKTKEKGGGTKGNWLNQPDIQLVYRGTRTWSRVYEPAIMLGVVTDDEMEMLEERRVAPAEQPALTAGLGELSPPKKSSRKAPEPSEPSDGSGEAVQAGPEPSQAQEAPTQAEPEVQDAEFEDATPAAEPAKPEPKDETKVAATAPAPDEIYILAGEEPEDDGYLTTYRDGVKWSRVKATAKALPKAYDLHAPRRVAAAQEPPPAGDDGAAAASAAPAAQGQTDATQESEFDEVEQLVATTPLAEAKAKIEEATSYLGGKQVVRSLQNTDAWKATPEEGKALLRKVLWDRYCQLYDAQTETTQPHEDFLLMRCFLEHGAKTLAEADAMWPKFWRHEAYRKATAADQQAMASLLAATKQRIVAS